ACRSYRNQLEKGCNFFKWVGDEVVDGRDLNIERQRKKIFMLKNKVLSIREMLKSTIVFGIVQSMKIDSHKKRTHPRVVSKGSEMIGSNIPTNALL
ncbi:hypothetical protein RYX36_036724, partial [Vicia faba]